MIFGNNLYRDIKDWIKKLEIVLSAPIQGEAGGKKRGGWREFRPPYKFWAKSVRIFSNAHRQKLMFLRL